MKLKTSELTGWQLDWAVGMVLGEYRPVAVPSYSTDWAQGGPIIEQYGIGLLFDSGSACRNPGWFATPDDQSTQSSYEGEYFDPAFMVDEGSGVRGPTPLIAAMRCFVASKLGDKIEIPDPKGDLP